MKLFKSEDKQNVVKGLLEGKSVRDSVKELVGETTTVNNIAAKTDEGFFSELDIERQDTQQYVNDCLDMLDELQDRLRGVLTSAEEIQSLSKAFGEKVVDKRITKFISELSKLQSGTDDHSVSSVRNLLNSIE